MASHTCRRFRGTSLDQPMMLKRIEKGDPAASLGNYATVLFALGMVDRF
jgi:hypothetical protein